MLHTTIAFLTENNLKNQYNQYPPTVTGVNLVKVTAAGTNPPKLETNMKLAAILSGLHIITRVVTPLVITIFALTYWLYGMLLQQNGV